MIRLTSLLAFATTSLALTFTSPFSGTTVDLTSSLTITWVPGSSDPSTFTLEIVNTNSGSSYGPQTLATDVKTSSISYTIPAGTIQEYGDNFEFLALDSNGKTIGTSASFSLADGVYTIQTASDGVLTIVTSSTQGSGPSSTSAASAAATTQSSASGSSSSGSSQSSSQVTSTSKASSASPRTSSVTHAPSTTLQSSSKSSSSSTTSSAAATSSSSSSDSGSDSNLGFGSAASVISGSVVVSFAAILGALAVLA